MAPIKQNTNVLIVPSKEWYTRRTSVASKLLLFRKLPVCIHSTFTMFRWGDVWERGHFEDMGIESRIILKRIFE
jgi:hypothetical protein